MLTQIFYSLQNLFWFASITLFPEVDCLNLHTFLLNKIIMSISKKSSNFLTNINKKKWQNIFYETGCVLQNS